MREILFRGKRKDNGEWVEGSLYESNDNRLYVIPKQTLWITKSDGDTMRSVYGAHDIINSSIGQFTGVLDKNGTKIFEGDIVEYSEKGYENILKAKVVFDSGSFSAIDRYGSEYRITDLDKDTTIEVIGNIHDNKDLIE